MDELQRRLVNHVRELARKRGIPLSHVPDRSGLGRSHFFDVLAGRASPTLDWVAKIASVFEIDPVELFEPTARNNAPPDDGSSGQGRKRPD